MLIELAGRATETKTTVFYCKFVDWMDRFEKPVMNITSKAALAGDDPSVDVELVTDALWDLLPDCSLGEVCSCRSA